MSEQQENPLYRIIDWDKHYEHGHSRTVDKKSYQHFPNRQDGLGYKRLVANKAEGERRYGCFCAMILTLSKQDKSVRAGWLTHNGLPDGEKYTALDLALMSGCTEEGMAQMLKACTSTGIAWVEIVDSEIKDIPKPPKSPKQRKSKPSDELDPEFLKFWEVYPSKVDKKIAYKSWVRITANSAVVIEGAKKYAKYTERSEQKHIKLPATFLDNDCWENEYIEKYTPAKRIDKSKIAFDATVNTIVDGWIHAEDRDGYMKTLVDKYADAPLYCGNDVIAESRKQIRGMK